MALRWLMLTAVVLAVGCRSRSDPARFTPSEEKARAALSAALEGWKAGAPGGTVPGTSAPVVQFVDSHRGKDQHLQSFEILGMIPGEGPRQFTVKLALANPEAEIKARYVVLGIDPTWVIRHEDLDMLTHWEHPMKKP
jgi:hypothetical protein